MSHKETKPATVKYVPTWDCAATQVYGALRVHHGDSPDTRDFLPRQVFVLIDEREAAAGMAAPPGRVIELMKRQVIVGPTID